MKQEVETFIPELRWATRDVTSLKSPTYHFHHSSLLLGSIIWSPKPSVYLKLSRLHKHGLCGSQVVLVVILGRLSLYIEVSIPAYIKRQRQQTVMNHSVVAALERMLDYFDSL